MIALERRIDWNLNEREMRETASHSSPLPFQLLVSSVSQSFTSFPRKIVIGAQPKSLRSTRDSLGARNFHSNNNQIASLEKLCLWIPVNFHLLSALSVARWKLRDKHSSQIPLSLILHDWLFGLLFLLPSSLAFHALSSYLLIKKRSAKILCLPLIGFSPWVFIEYNKNNINEINPRISNFFLQSKRKIYLPSQKVNFMNTRNGTRREIESRRCVGFPGIIRHVTRLTNDPRLMGFRKTRQDLHSLFTRQQLSDFFPLFVRDAFSVMFWIMHERLSFRC